MITLSPTSALMAYLFLTMGIVMATWIASHVAARKRRLSLSEKILFVCEYCQGAYLDREIREVTRCPECRSFNKNNRFRK